MKPQLPKPSKHCKLIDVEIWQWKANKENHCKHASGSTSLGAKPNT
jgi:hypothetical protein